MLKSIIQLAFEVFGRLNERLSRILVLVIITLNAVGMSLLFINLPTSWIPLLGLLSLVNILFIVGLYIIGLRHFNQAERGRSLLSRYASVFESRSDKSWSFRRWEQNVVIRSNGDTEDFVRFRANSEDDEIYFLRLVSGANWSQPASVRKHVHVVVKSIVFDGTRSLLWAVTTSWISNGRMEILIHLANPVPRGAQVEVVYETKWPGKSRPLMEGRVDEFNVNFSSSIEQLTYEIVLPKGNSVYVEPVGFNRDDKSIQLQTLKIDEKEVVKVVASNAPAKRRIGVRLQLKR